MSTASTTTATALPTGAWSVDKIHSRVEFEVEHLGLSAFRGSFSDYDARLVSGERGLAVEGAAQVESVSTEGDLRAHLLSPEFFDAERHPAITFRSESITLGEGGEIEVEGELTIRDATKTVQATGRIGEPGVGPDGAARIGVALEATVDRHEFGLGWNMELPNGKQALGDDVKLIVTLELVEEAE